MSADNKEPTLTPEEIEVNSIIADTSRITQDIEQQIRDLPSDKGPELRPEGMPGNRRLGQKGLDKYQLQQNLEKVKSEANEKLDSIVQNSSYNTQLRIHASIDAWRNPDHLEKRRMQEKDITQSQDMAMRVLADGKGRSSVAIEKESGERTEHQPEKISEGKTNSAATRFTQSLHYTRLEGILPPEPDRSEKPREIERDEY